MLAGGEGNRRSAPPKSRARHTRIDRPLGRSIEMVAGRGFEPLTFGL